MCSLSGRSLRPQLWHGCGTNFSLSVIVSVIGTTTGVVVVADPAKIVETNGLNFASVLGTFVRRNSLISLIVFLMLALITSVSITVMLVVAAGAAVLDGPCCCGLDGGCSLTLLVVITLLLILRLLLDRNLFERRLEIG